MMMGNRRQPGLRDHFSHGQSQGDVHGDCLNVLRNDSFDAEPLD